jgi:hypothetical protein
MRTPLSFEKDYLICHPEDPERWDVWHLPTFAHLSTHGTQQDAKAAVKRYANADARRANAPIR